MMNLAVMKKQGESLRAKRRRDAIADWSWPSLFMLKYKQDIVPRELELEQTYEISQELKLVVAKLEPSSLHKGPSYPITAAD